MPNPIKLLYLGLLLGVFGFSHAQEKPNAHLDTAYGSNEKVGKHISINGAQLYYEEYGKGEPLLLIHGNNGSIKSMGNQIDYFKDNYRVIVADNRGHGKSELNTDSLTCVQITKDWKELVNYLGLDSIHILGWSDGGIIGLKMGISGRCNLQKIIANSMSTIICRSFCRLLHRIS